MAEVKISALPAATDVTGDDLVPVVDGGTTTKKATFQQVLDYVTGSTFNDLTVTSLTASVSGTFVGDGTLITGVTAEWDGSHLGDASITGSLWVSGSLIADVALSGAVGSEITSTSYTLSADDRGKTLLFSSSATQGITCSSGLSVGYNSTFIQLGSGQLELTASGVSVLNRQSHTKSAGLYAAVSVVIVSADTYILAGDTSA